MIRPLLLALLVLAGCEKLRVAGSEPGTPQGHEGHAEAGTVAAPADEIAYWTCPMHPSIQQPGPGSCPICGMTLTPVKRSELESGAVRVDAARRARFGIELEPAMVRHMGASLRLTAIVAWDPDRVEDVSARVAGWIGELFGAPGEQVREGQLLYTLYSPELVAAQDDLLRASAQQMSGTAGATDRREAARRRLIRWGLTEAQVDGVLRARKASENVPFFAPRGGWVMERTALEGGVVSPGQTVFRIGDLSQVWVEAAVPEARLADVAVGQDASVTVEGQQAPRLGKIARVLPELNATTRTARVRIVLANPDLALRPDQWATVVIDVDGGDHLAVPESAVLYTGPRRLVFVDAGDDLLAPREIQIGMKSEGYVEVVKGLEDGELVVRAGNFLVAADSRLKAGNETGGHKHGGGEDK